MMTTSASKTRAVALLLTFAGVALAVSRRNKAKAATSTQQLPSDRPVAQLPANTRHSTAEEGQPLAWDRTEHPLTERGLDDDSGLSVAPVTVTDATPAPAAAPMPSSSAASNKPAPAAAPKPPAAAASAKRKPAPAAHASNKPAPAAAPKPPAASSAAPPATRAPEQAAQELYDYARMMLARKQGSALGVKGKPSDVVRAAQADMGQITVDGIYGPTTRARGKQLLGKTFPART